MVHVLHTPRVCWADIAADIVLARITAQLSQCGHCSVMLTGGRSAAQLYTALAGRPDFRQISGVEFYFGDERCVTPENAESNFGLAMRTLFSAGVPESCVVHRIEGESEDHEAAADRYAMLLPDRIDVLLLGVGEDGHVASIFPRSGLLGEARRVLPVSAPKPPQRRLTITPTVIESARSVFLLAAGPTKSAILAEALREPNEVDAFPARMVLGAVWLMDN
jgi:6-phosphogluconolactonase